MQKDPDNNINSLPQKQEMPALKERKSSSSNQCDICFEQFHILGKWPMLACPNSHYFCDQCIKGMLERNNNEPVPCPMCRALIKKSLVKPNVQLFRALNEGNTVKFALKSQKNELFMYAFQYQIFEIATLFKQNKSDQLQKILKLDISNRNINKIEHISILKSLQSLQLQNNAIKSLSGLQGLNNLKILNLNHNIIQSIDELCSLPKLDSLAVEFNQIKEVDMFQFSKLKHLFLYGNPLREMLVDQFLMVEFPKLNTLSFSIQHELSEYLNRNFIESLGICENLPSLKKLIISELSNEKDRQELQKIAKTIYGFVELVWIKPKTLQFHEKWMHQFYLDQHYYGESFNFVVDPLSPFLKDYELKGQKVIKKTSNFTSLNCALPIPKQGKQSFKFKIVEPSQHFFIGISNAYIKHNVNIYSEQFIGLTFWGQIYSRGQCIPVVSRLGIQQKPVIRMTLDFDQQSIIWYSDEQMIGFIPLPQQFRYSELYFVFGMRDKDTSIELLLE